MAKQRRHQWTTEQDDALLAAVNESRSGPRAAIDWHAVVQAAGLRGVLALGAPKAKSRYAVLRNLNITATKPARRVDGKVAKVKPHRDIDVSDAALRATAARAADVNYCPACGCNLGALREAMTALALLPNGADR